SPRPERLRSFPPRPAKPSSPVGDARQGDEMKGLRRDPERTELRALRRRIPLEGARILEVGCGDGRLTRRIAPLARACVATNPTEACIARARGLPRAGV